MSKKLQYNSPKGGATQLHDTSTGKRLTIVQGFNNISDEDYELFEAKIKANTHMSVMSESINDTPQEVKLAKAPESKPVEKTQERSAKTDSKSEAAVSPEQQLAHHGKDDDKKK